MDNEISQLLLLALCCVAAIVIADWLCGRGIATMTIDLHGLQIFGPSLVYASIRADK